MKKPTNEQIREAVRQTYAAAAKAEGHCCGGESPASTCRAYSEREHASIPQGADMGLGCGNPVALASLNPGETVLDLGSGGGVDCFLAARRVGSTGRVIGVDMTEEMIAKANALATEGGYDNVEFRAGTIEELPVEDDSVDVIISNCVINLSPDKPRVFQEAFRVLRPGGRLAVSDVVTTRPLPNKVRENLAAYAGCVAGAATIADVQAMLERAGFENIEITAPTHDSKRQQCCAVSSASITARKPAAAPAPTPRRRLLRHWGFDSLELSLPVAPGVLMLKV